MYIHKDIENIFVHTTPNKFSKMSHRIAALALGDILGRTRDDDLLPCQRWCGPISLWVRCHVFLAVDLKDLCQDGLEGIFNIGRLQRGGLKEEEVLLLSKLLSIIGAYGTLLFEVTLVADQHDDNVLVSMAPKLFQPTRYVVEALAFCDIID